ncbi:MAG: phage head closure protein [Ottowia sp.]|nr:phage head closure protein [Ottowia sp.]
MSMLPAANFSQRVRLQKQITTQNSLGESVGTWINVALVWADIRYLNGKEYLAAQLEISKANISMRIRWRNDVNAAMRVLHGNHIYNIEVVLPDMQERMHLDLVCSIGLNKG